MARGCKTREDAEEKGFGTMAYELGKNIKEELKFWTPGGWVLDEAYDFFVGSDSRSAQVIA